MNSDQFNINYLLAKNPELVELLSELPPEEVQKLLSEIALSASVRPEDSAQEKAAVPTPRAPAPVISEATAEFIALPDMTRVDRKKNNAEAPAPAPAVGRKLGSIIFNCLFYLLIIAIVGGAALFALSNNAQKSYFGYRLYTVKTPSMTPQPGGPSGGFRVGDTILVKLCDPASVKAGDIITFTPGTDPNVYLTHRVVKVLDQLNGNEGRFFVTKGDANPSDDPPIAAKAVVGTSIAVIPKTGTIIEFIRANFVLCVVAIISATGSLILLRMYFSDPSKKRPEEHALLTLSMAKS